MQRPTWQMLFHTQHVARRGPPHKFHCIKHVERRHGQPPQASWRARGDQRNQSQTARSGVRCEDENQSGVCAQCANREQHQRHDRRRQGDANGKCRFLVRANTRRGYRLVGAGSESGRGPVDCCLTGRGVSRHGETPMLSPCSLMEVGVTLTLAESESIVEGALSAARRLKIKVCVAVCNRQGRPIALSCMDGTYAEAGRAAIGKAVASASTGQPSGEIRGIPMHPSAGLVVAEGMPVLRSLVVCQYREMPKLTAAAESPARSRMTWMRYARGLASPHLMADRTLRREDKSMTQATTMNRRRGLQQNSRHQNEHLDEALEETFPASDPPAMTDPIRAERESHKSNAESRLRVKQTARRRVKAN
jgi:uncharacterized protein GlcG (DUF336 family)